MQHLEDLSWNQLVTELKDLADSHPPPDGPKDDPHVVLHNLFVHQVELEMQNRELRDAQQRLEASRARYVDLYDFAPVGFLAIGRDERIQEINLTGAALVGRDRGAILGRPFLAVVPLRDKAMVFHAHVRRCVEGLCRADDEIEFSPPGRPPMLLHMTSAPLLDAEGKAVACRTALLDVTDRRRAELAETDVRMKEEFLGTLSHELRTPLTAIVGWVDLLRAYEKRDQAVDPKTLRRGLEVIARNAATQVRLIEDILDVSRILAGKLRVELRPLHLARTVHEAIENHRHTAAARGLDLSVSVAGDAVVLGDRDRIAQVLTNLLGNAVKFTPAGGKVDLSVTCDPDFVHIAVHDTGCGLSQQELPHVFERFRQVDSTSTRTVGGLGLGLAIVDHIVRAHGGAVAASSPGLGLGATFAVRLRRARDAPKSARPVVLTGPSFTDGNALEGLAVLCIDDDVDALEVVAIVLRDSGAQVRTARSAAEALTAISAARPDLVVSDIGLPSEDGYALMHRIRALPGDARRVPAIALTAYADGVSAELARAAGFDCFLSKPVAAELLVRTVASVARESGALPPAPATP